MLGIYTFECIYYLCVQHEGEEEIGLFLCSLKQWVQQRLSEYSFLILPLQIYTLVRNTSHRTPSLGWVLSMQLPS